MSKGKKPKDQRITLLFFTGNKNDRSGMVAFKDVMGCRTKFFVSKDSSVIPSPTKQRFECIFTGGFLSIDRKEKTATAFAKLVRHVPERIPTFEEKAANATAKLAPPPAHNMGKAGDLLSLLIDQASPKTSAGRKRNKSEMDREIRNRMKNGGKDCGKKKQRAVA